MALTFTLKHQLSNLFLVSQLGYDLTPALGRNKEEKKRAEERLLQVVKQPAADPSPGPQRGTDLPPHLCRCQPSRAGARQLSYESGVFSVCPRPTCSLLLLFYPLSLPVSYSLTYIFCPNIPKCVKLVFVCKTNLCFLTAQIAAPLPRHLLLPLPITPVPLFIFSFQTEIQPLWSRMKIPCKLFFS